MKAKCILDGRPIAWHLYFRHALKLEFWAGSLLLNFYDMMSVWFMGMMSFFFANYFKLTIWRDLIQFHHGIFSFLLIVSTCGCHIHKQCSTFPYKLYWKLKNEKHHVSWTLDKPIDHVKWISRGNTQQRGFQAFKLSKSEPHHH